MGKKLNRKAENWWRGLENCSGVPHKQFGRVPGGLALAINFRPTWLKIWGKRKVGRAAAVRCENSQFSILFILQGLIQILVLSVYEHEFILMYELLKEGQGPFLCPVYLAHCSQHHVIIQWLNQTSRQPSPTVPRGLQPLWMLSISWSGSGYCCWWRLVKQDGTSENSCPCSARLDEASISILILD